MIIEQPFFKFTPILKEKIWGGDKLIKLLHKSSDKSNIGESWEISDVEGDTSIVSNGPCQGMSLKELISNEKGRFVGERVYSAFGDKFPLLIKYIDAKEALSIQLHPHDDLAMQRHNSFGKTEMWYVMQADEQANLIVGFKKDTDKEEYLKHLNNKSLTEILNIDTVANGDVYFIPTGRVHAIGAGVMLAEIQQTSDVTYRIYDWDRQDSEGNYRELHTEEAIDAIDYKAQDSYTTAYQKVTNSSSEMVSCPYFTTNILPIEGSVSYGKRGLDSFLIYMCVKGEVRFESNGVEATIKMGETLLIPAYVQSYTLHSLAETSELLEVYLPEN